MMYVLTGLKRQAVIEFPNRISSSSGFNYIVVENKFRIVFGDAIMMVYLCRVLICF